MIKQRAIAAAALVVVFSLYCGHAQAQLSPGYGAGSHAVGRPTVSPYLNLVVSDVLSQNVGTAGGYQTLVRPFVDSRRAIGANAAAISRLQSGQGAYGGGGGGGGGGAAGKYMNYSHYFPGMGR